MPYVDEDDAAEIDGGAHPETVGELTYAVAKLLDDYAGPAPDYQRLAEARVAAINAADEFYRRVIAPYEDDVRRLPGRVDPHARVRHPIGHKESAR